MSYEERCKKLGWPVLSVRRDYLNLIECYKIVFGISDNLNFSDLFEMSKSQRTRANHRYKLYTKRAKANAYKYSFFVRIISLKQLTEQHRNVFKSRLKQYLNI